MSGFNTKEKNNNGEYEITFYTNNYGEFKTVETLCQNIIGHEKPNSKGDLISRSEVEKLGATCLAKRNEKGQLEAIISLDNAPTVETDIEVVAKDAYKQGYTDGWKERFGEPNERTQGDLADEVWKLYEKYHSHLATHVIEFGDELKELLIKYMKGGAE